MTELLIASFSRKISLLENKKEKIIVEGAGPYWGITWSDDAFYFVDQQLSSTNAIFQVNKKRELRQIPFLGNNIHQIFFKDDNLFVCNTGEDCIDILKDIQNFCKNSSCIAKSTVKKDKNHINSVWISPEFSYAAFHRYGKSRVVCLNKDFNLTDTGFDLGEKIHNLLRVGNKFYTCSSGEGVFIEYDLATKHIKKHDILKKFKIKKNISFIRGLAKTKDFFYIGVCETFKSGRRNGNGRHDSSHESSYIMKLNNDMQACDLIEIKNSGQLYDLRVVGKEDYAHNTNTFPLEIL